MASLKVRSSSPGLIWSHSNEEALRDRWMWFWNANYIALDMIKTQRQHYFSRFNPADLGDPPEAIWLLEHPWMARGLFASGVVLEAIAFLPLRADALAWLLGWALF